MLSGTTENSEKPIAVIGRYTLYGVIGRGGLASVHLGRMFGVGRFSRTVAIKRLHAHFASDPEVSSSLIDEARLTARIRHPNVVQTIDVVAVDGEVLLVMDYIEGESLARLLAAGGVPIRIAAAILIGVLEGLHAAHQAKTEDGAPLGLVHRDVSPQNIMVGTDGIARIIDFGVAKAAGRARSTESGHAKGKLGYMAPEQVRGKQLSPKTDVFAASIVLWEALTGQRLFGRANEGETVFAVLEAPIAAPGEAVPGLPPDLDDVVLKGLRRDPAERWDDAAQMAAAIEATVTPAPAREVAAWVKDICASALETRARLVSAIESETREPVPAKIDFADSANSDTKSVVPVAELPSLPRSRNFKRFGFAAAALIAISVLAFLAMFSARTPAAPAREPVVPSASSPLVPAEMISAAPDESSKAPAAAPSVQRSTRIEPSPRQSPSAVPSADRWRLRTRN